MTPINNKVKAWVYEYDLPNGEYRVAFLSEIQHCDSCLDERSLGFGGDINGCCCSHVNEWKRLKELKIKSHDKGVNNDTN